MAEHEAPLKASIPQRIPRPAQRRADVDTARPSNPPIPTAPVGIVWTEERAGELDLGEHIRQVFPPHRAETLKRLADHDPAHELVVLDEGLEL